MFLMFTPYTFIFSFIYFSLLMSLFYISDFYVFWLIMEIIMLLFMGVSYTVFTSSFSYLMIYFLVQTVASFSILLFYMFDMNLLLTLSFFLKLGLFPFHNWFINVSRRFPNFVLYLASTFHKLPVFLMFDYFFSFSNFDVIIFICSINLFICGVTMINSGELRTIVVLSSVANNSWFLISSYISIYLFLTFFVFYSLLTFFVFYSLSSLNNFSYSAYNHNSTMFGVFFLVMLSGMPPFPIFFCKMLVFYSLILSFGFSFSVFFFIISSCLVFIGYYRLLVKYFIYSYTSSFMKYLI